VLFPVVSARPCFPVLPARPHFGEEGWRSVTPNGRKSTRQPSVSPTSMGIKSLAERKAWHMPRWVRSLAPPLFGGLLGGAIAFVALLIATLAHLDVLHQFQTLVIGILAIFASLIALFGVHMQILNARTIEENRLKRDALAFATALLRQTEEFQSKLFLMYRLCNSAAQDGSYEGVKRFCEDMQEITFPELFEAPWRDIGLLNPDITLIIHSLKESLQLAKSMAASNPWLEKQPVIPGLFKNDFSSMEKLEEKETQSEMKNFVRVQIGYYDDMIKQELQALITCLEAEAEEYAMQLGLDERRKSLRARAKALRDTRMQSGGA
jgi:hypothetical protein